ncbi:hypothetical protein F5Y09DRAFT_324229 [Xylaria sp. FL1042]|nr:hypothetical protein F5Y09DRAFT_324229 [Xylaria sp. FL1042]
MPLEMNLTLGYVTNSGSEPPTYDMTLKTSTNLEVLCFGACLINQASETWGEHKIVASTSQADSPGHSELVLTLVS